MEKYCYLNGKILNIEKAKVGVADIGLLRGFGVFDGLRTYNGKPFLFEKHFDRFCQSAKIVGLNVPVSKDEAELIIEKLVIKNKARETSIRMVLTGGESPDGTSFNVEKPTFYVLLHTLAPISMKMYENGVKMVTVNHQREMPRAKSNNYITKLSQEYFRTKEGAHELLYIEDDFVLEGATCNVFMFKNSKLITPKDDILLGTRRWLTLNVAKDHFEIEERKVELSEFLNADEIFMTSTNRDILPVTQLNDQKIGNGKVGNNTKLLMKLYQEYIHKNR